MYSGILTLDLLQPDAWLQLFTLLHYGELYYSHWHLWQISGGNLRRIRHIKMFTLSMIAAHVGTHQIWLMRIRKRSRITSSTKNRISRIKDLTKRTRILHRPGWESYQSVCSVWWLLILCQSPHLCQTSICHQHISWALSTCRLQGLMHFTKSRNILLGLNIVLILMNH